MYNLGTNIFLGEISYITKALVAVLQLGVTTDFSIFLYHSYESKKKIYKTKEEAMKEAINIYISYRFITYNCSWISSIMHNEINAWT